MPKTIRIGGARGKLAIRTSRRQMGRMLNKRQKRQVKSLIGRRLETKFIQGSSTLTGYTNAGTIASFPMPANGNTAITRVGNQITVKRIRLRYSCVGYDTTNLIRVMVIKWNNDSSNYAPVVNSILDASMLGVDTSPLALYNWDNYKARDFRVCYDRVHPLSFNNTTAAPGSNVATKAISLFGKKLHGGRIELNTGSQIGDGMYYLLIISDSAIAGHPKVNYTYRIEYTDA